MSLAFPILAYHKVDYKIELGITSLSPKRFYKQIELLSQDGCVDILPQLTEIIDIAPKQLDSVTRPFVITFDDGYENIYTYAYPVLMEYAFTAIIFVTAGYIGKYNHWDASPGPRFRHLDWTQIREMSKHGILIGSHGFNHKFLTQRNHREAKFELEYSKKKLEDGLGSPVNFFSYPYGNYDKRIINFAREAGYKAAFSLCPEMVKTEFHLADDFLYALPRIAIYSLDNIRSFKAKIGHSRNGSISYAQRLKNQIINKCAYAGMLVEKLKL